MNLLLISQKIDRGDSVLGFFHRWCEKFSEKIQNLNVICLEKRENRLPAEVAVWSLGKESGASRVKYCLRFLSYIWKLRGGYDTVLVHMNPVYVLLGAIFWTVSGKKYYLWYNHHYGGFLASCAMRVAKKSFYTSPYAFTARFKNSRQMPAGIDIEVFKPDAAHIKRSGSILYVGRISPIKKVDILIRAADHMYKKGVQFELRIAGGSEPHDAGYLRSVQALAAPLVEKGIVEFIGPLPNHETPRLYNEHELCINLSPAGLFDKAVLEAMACESLVLVSSKAFESFLPGMCMFQEDDPADLAEKAAVILGLSAIQKKNLGRDFRNHILKQHALDRLIADICTSCAE